MWPLGAVSAASLSSITGNIPCTPPYSGLTGILCSWASGMPNVNGAAGNSVHAYCSYHATLSCGLHLQNTSSKIKLLKFIRQKEQNIKPSSRTFWGQGWWWVGFVTCQGHIHEASPRQVGVISLAAHSATLLQLCFHVWFLVLVHLDV